MQEKKIKNELKTKRVERNRFRRSRFKRNRVLREMRYEQNQQIIILCIGTQISLTMD